MIILAYINSKGLPELESLKLFDRILELLVPTVEIKYFTQTRYLSVFGLFLPIDGVCSKELLSLLNNS